MKDFEMMKDRSNSEVQDAKMSQIEILNRTTLASIGGDMKAQRREVIKTIQAEKPLSLAETE